MSIQQHSQLQSQVAQCQCPNQCPCQCPLLPLTYRDKIEITKIHFENKGYRVHSGLQFGCELVLYADVPSRVHSDFCVHILDCSGTGGSDYYNNDDNGNNVCSDRLNWMTAQILVRAAPDLHKTLIIVNVKHVPCTHCHHSSNHNHIHIMNIQVPPSDAIQYHPHENQNGCSCHYYIVEEIAIASEHAPFRHKHKSNNSHYLNLQVGKQVKKNNRT